MKCNCIYYCIYCGKSVEKPETEYTDGAVAHDACWVSVVEGDGTDE